MRRNIEMLRMTGEVTLRDLSKGINIFLGCKQLNTFDQPYYIRKSLGSEPSPFLLVNRYIIFNKFDKHIQLNMMIYTGALSGLT